ncbi:beta-ketoacyl-ACP synthase II [Paenibacillus aurantius]|uniref:3-oxoacyl-[acyl-carrier-protein] synthase 2 n=1 Tax=Paenibacillus aurantius TaxID=2918900 RepID=A0AA96LD45_9BACL|nr:beta-ketoacyl-ACP synthase II [Paenibacillus aurantius]WNQ09527.1 beta-ketoacyl-ACP synthase II [Paenibacillus aurantius]
MERVVITGMGVISPLGHTVEEYWRKLVRGESGVTRIDTFDVSRHKTKIAGLVRNFDGEGLFSRKEARRMDRFCQFALAAAEQAREDSGIDLGAMDRERLGVFVGSGVGGLQTLVDQDGILRERGPERVSPLLVPMMISNMAAAMISMKWGAKGPSLSPVTACSIGNTSIGEAYRLIRAGALDAVAAGGAEAAVTEIALAGFGNAAALSTRNEEPQRASRPFDAGRDGFVMAEGAGVLLLESLTHARRRGARPYAEVIGYGASSDAYHMVATHPEGAGAYQAMKQALGEAGLSPQDVDVISAHATGTEIGDRSETMAIKKLFGKEAYRIPVTANKSMTGHLLGASSAVEAIALVKTLQDSLIPPTINLENEDPECDLDYVPGKARDSGDHPLRFGISNSFGFGGHNAVIALKAFRE